MSSQRFRRIVAGISLVLFPVLLLASEAVDPLPSDNSYALVLDAATEHEGALVSSALLLLASSAFMVPAVFGLAQTVQGRGSRLIHFGVLFGVLGAFGHACAAVYYLILSTMPGGNRDEMIALLERIDESAAGAVVIPLILSFAVSIVLLAFGAWRARAASALVPTAIVGAVVLEVVSPVLPDSFALVKQALVLASFGWLGVRMLSMGDAAWAQPQTEAEASPEVALAPAA